MTCRELVGFLSTYVEGALTPVERAAFEKHVRTCPDCVAYLMSYEETVKLGKAAFAQPDDPVPAGVPDGLVQAILAARGRRA